MSLRDSAGTEAQSPRSVTTIHYFDHGALELIFQEDTLRASWLDRQTDNTFTHCYSDVTAFCGGGFTVDMDAMIDLAQAKPCVTKTSTGVSVRWTQQILRRELVVDLPLAKDIVPQDSNAMLGSKLRAQNMRLVAMKDKLLAPPMVSKSVDMLLDNQPREGADVMTFAEVLKALQECEKDPAAMKQLAGPSGALRTVLMRNKEQLTRILEKLPVAGLVLHQD